MQGDDGDIAFPIPGPAGPAGPQGATGSGGTTDLRNGLYDFDDFTNGLPATSAPTGGGKTIYASQNGGILSASSAAGHLGVVNVDTGPNSNGYLRLQSVGASVGLGYPLGSGDVEITWLFKTPSSLSSGTDRYSILAGVGDVIASTQNSVMFTYSDNINSGKPVVRVNVAGTNQTDVAGTTTIAASTWYRARLVINAALTSASLYLAVNGGAENLEATYTGSFPATSVLFGAWFGILKSAGTNNRSCLVDYWQLNYTLASQR